MQLKAIIDNAKTSEINSDRDAREGWEGRQTRGTVTERLGGPANRKRRRGAPTLERIRCHPYNGCVALPTQARIIFVLNTKDKEIEEEEYILLILLYNGRWFVRDLLSHISCLVRTKVPK